VPERKDILRAYLIEGKSARDIALTLDLSTSRVRMLLGKLGISVPPEKIRDEVCEAIAWNGFGSFAQFVQQHGLRSLGDQAQELKVGKRGLERLYEHFRRLIEHAEETEPGRTERGSQASEAG
jgi:hypothetical protein